VSLRSLKSPALGHDGGVRPPLDVSIDLLTTALAADHDRLAEELHLLATEALDEANSAEEAADALADVMKTLTVLSAESLRSLSGALVAALAANGPDAAIAIELGASPVTASGSDEATSIAVELVRSAAS
jgi:hypothetical protein